MQPSQGSLESRVNDRSGKVSTRIIRGSRCSKDKLIKRTTSARLSFSNNYTEAGGKRGGRKGSWTENYHPCAHLAYTCCVDESRRDRSNFRREDLLDMLLCIFCAKCSDGVRRYLVGPWRRWLYLAMQGRNESGCKLSLVTIEGLIVWLWVELWCAEWWAKKKMCKSIFNK